MERSEDAGIYKLSEELAIIQTVDFFTPIVDDPYSFGQIAVANAISDVYAKGGKPLTALNIVCFPVKTMDISILREILAGGLDKMQEAGVILVGGHSVEDEELKYGLSVTGAIHPLKVVPNNGARIGDRLILTKPLGVGIISTALKGGVVGKATVDKVIGCMSTLNRQASELMQKNQVNACTDITGFGLLGHVGEMIEGTEVGVVIDSAAVPCFPETKKFIDMGLIPAGLFRNRDFRIHMVEVGGEVPAYMMDILFDPQTSGGLLISVAAEKAAALLAAMHEQGISQAAIIGEVVAEPKGRILVK